MTLLLSSKVSFLFLVPQRERQMKCGPLHHLQMGNIIDWLFNVFTTSGFKKIFYVCIESEKSMFMDNPDVQNPMLNWIFSLQILFPLSRIKVISFVIHHNIYVE